MKKIINYIKTKKLKAAIVALLSASAFAVTSGYFEYFGYRIAEISFGDSNQLFHHESNTDISNTRFRMCRLKICNQNSSLARENLFFNASGLTSPISNLSLSPPKKGRLFSVWEFNFLNKSCIILCCDSG